MKQICIDKHYPFTYIHYLNESGEIVGSLGYDCLCKHLHFIKVAPSYCHQGIAKKLLGELIKLHGDKEIDLLVHPMRDDVKREGLIRLYESFGFRRFGDPLKYEMIREPYKC